MVRWFSYLFVVFDKLANLLLLTKTIKTLSTFIFYFLLHRPFVLYQNGTLSPGLYYLWSFGSPNLFLFTHTRMAYFFSSPLAFPSASTGTYSHYHPALYLIGCLIRFFSPMQSFLSTCFFSFGLWFPQRRYVFPIPAVLSLVRCLMRFFSPKLWLRFSIFTFVAFFFAFLWRWPVSSFPRSLLPIRD